MTAQLWLDNLIAYSVQLALLATAALLLPPLLRLRPPRAVHALLQAVLVLSLLLPALQPWAQAGAGRATISFDRTLPAGDPPAGAATIPPASVTVLALLGVATALRFLWLTAGLFRLRLYRRQARLVDSLPAEVDALQQQFGVHPAFYLHPGLAGAVTFGLRRPAILLPASFSSMEPGLRAAVACHELWHVRRRDWLWTLAEEALRALFWFHPFVLRLIDRIRLTREQVVDALTVRATGSRERYIQALLETAAAPVRPGFAAPSFLRHRHLAERLSLLARGVAMSKTRLVVSVAAATAAVAVVAILAALWLPLQTAAVPLPDAPKSQVKPPPPPSPAAKKKPAKVYRAGNGVTAPVVLYKVEPQYTQEAKDRKIEGVVVLYAEIIPQGRVDTVKVTTSLDPGLDANAIAAVRKWKFKPGTKDGKPVTVAATIEVNFRLF